MEIKDFLSLMWRHVRLLGLGLVAGALLGLAAVILQPPLYEATTKVLVNRPSQQSSVDLLPLSEDQLVATNALLVKTKPVLDDASYQLGTKIDPDSILVTEIPNTLIIQIKVQDRDAKQAAAIANTLVNILIQENEKLLAGRYAATETSLTSQIDQVQKQIDSLQAQFTQMNDASIQEQLKIVNQQIDQSKASIASLQQDINNFPSNLTVANSAALADKQAQLDQARSLLNIYQQIQVNLTFTGQPGQGGTSREISSLTNIQSNIDLYQQIYLKLQASLESNRADRTQNTLIVLQIDPAVAPKLPLYPLPVLYILLGSLVGFVLSAGAILLLDHLANSLKNPGQTEKLLGLPVLGQLSDLNHGKVGLVSLQDPLSPGAEAFRSLGASLQIATAERKFCTLMVANAGAAEGKTPVAANLAVVYAQQGRQVILLDGDLRHPHLHSLFGIENQRGLANMIAGSSSTTVFGDGVKEVEALTVIPSGSVASASTGWMDAEKWALVLSNLQQEENLVIVDGASSETADAQMLASSVDGVLLVIRAGQTPADAAQAALRRFKLAGARVLGVVFYSGLHDQTLETQIFSWAKLKLHKKEDHSAGGGKIKDAPVLPS